MEYAKDGVAATACLAHIDPIFTILPPTSACDHVPRNRLRDEEQRPVDTEIAVVVASSVLKKCFWNEYPRGIHQVVCVRVLGVDPGTQVFHLGHAREVGFLPGNNAEMAEFFDGCRDAIVQMSTYDSRTAALQDELGDHHAHPAGAPDDHEFLSSEVSHRVPCFRVDARMDVVFDMDSRATSSHNSVWWEQAGLDS